VANKAIMYSEQSIRGKGVGCVAERDISAGELVLSECPGLWLQSHFRRRGLVGNIVSAYQAMSEASREEYLNLANKYDIDQGHWSEYSKEIFKLRQEELRTLGLTDMSEETATRLWQIYETNSFPNGVFLKMSRLNHSCCPNAEFSWRQRTGRREVRAARKIIQGEEILISYSRIGRETSTRVRRGYLRDVYHFLCDCVECDKTEEEMEEEEKQAEEMRKRQAEEQKVEESLFIMNCHFDF